MNRSPLWILMVIAGVSGSVTGVHAQDSPHGNLSVSCDNCHDTDSWKTLASPMKFSHASTGFALNGRHAQVACKQCHATLRFSETPNQCASCHQDVHRKELGTSCERCHSPASWLVPDMPQRHISTRFALLGAHRLAQCQACHTNQQKHTYSGAPLECVSCHRADYDATVAPPHRSSGINTDCQSCHSVSALSWGRNFDHNTTGFTLVGAHATAACAACHQNGVYKGLTHDCYGCHAAAYNATRAPSHRSSGINVDCASCHSPSKGSWGGSFDHATTGFPLTGSHVAVACLTCHKNNIFKGLPMSCYSCHASDYTGTKTPPHQSSGFGTDCIQCHASTATTWGAKFDHAATAFPLTGSHVAVACLTCHKNNVFKGLPSNCYSCHVTDYNGTTTPPHQSSGFGTDCIQCHASTATTWGAKFDHAATAFPLTGSHVAVACLTCHKNNVFKGLPMSCYSCHATDYNGTKTPPHQSSGFGTDCIQCHASTATTWGAKFDHAATAFPLTGSHVAVACLTCHKNNIFKGLPMSCYSCHATDYNGTKTPPHQASGFGTDCIQCHASTATTWGAKFDHAATAFPLTGSHVAVACLTCHKNNVFKGLPMSCYSCHATDYNGTKTPPHQASGFGTDCIQCHASTATTWGAKFDHSATAFPLTGSHVAVACLTCHKNNVFKGLPSNCYSCHVTDYNGTTTPPHQSSGFGTDCIQCHASTATTWGGKFDHSTTAFALNGSHAAVPCLQCHKNNVFKGLTTDCYTCHTADYKATTKPPHQAAGFGIDCVTCHSSSAVNWAGSFNHSLTGFALTGKHVGVACAQCHVNNVYKGLPSTCASCHQTDYNASTNPAHASSGFPTSCETCHSTTAWAPSTFNHDPSFPIAAGTTHSPGRWTACADCHTSSADFRVYSCLTCHAHAQATMDAKHAGRSRYSYTSSACYSCHPRGRAD